MTIKNLLPLPVVALAALLCAPATGFARSILLTAGNFTLLGGTAITGSGVAGTIISNGNVGLAPGATSGITGFPPAVITGGAIISTGLVTGQARLDLITASVSLAGMASNANMSNVDLGGKTLAPGVYTFTGAAGLTGALTLDAQGKNNVFWVFQVATAFTTSVNSTVTVINAGSNGGSDDAIFWNAGSAIVIGGNNVVVGNYLAGTSITLGSNSSGGARALALAGVSLNSNVINSHGGPGGSDWTGGLTYDPSGNVALAQFPAPSCITVDASGNLYVGDSSIDTIQMIAPTGVVSLIAGTTGSAGSADGTGTHALFNQPDGIIVSSTGTLYVADTGNSTIRKIAPGGIVTTFAGSAANPSYRDGVGTATGFNAPVGIALDAVGNLYVADKNNAVIRKITFNNATVTTFAGAAGVLGSTDSPARFNAPYGMAVDKNSGNIYASDSGNNTIRKITSFGAVTTNAGLALATGSADGTGNAARFNLPGGLATDAAGNVYIADTASSTIRMMTPGGTVTTIAGQAGVQGQVDGTGSNALFNQPEDLTVDNSGNIYVADT
ncbi:MAG TPA: ice-binding family protein, partial [Opitutaceae bacterium]|nr:ice-binding family protein [Opitutaceae bacterium]